MKRGADLERIAEIRRLQELAARSAAQKASLDLAAGEEARSQADTQVAAAEAEWQTFAEGPGISPQGLMSFAREVVDAATIARRASQEVDRLTTEKDRQAEAWLWAQTRTHSAEELAKEQRKDLERAREERRLQEIEDSHSPEREG